MPRPRKEASTTAAVVTAVATPVDCSKYSALAPDTRALIYSGIDNIRDLTIIARAVEACGLRCEVERSSIDGAKIAVYAARRKSG